MGRPRKVADSDVQFARSWMDQRQKLLEQLAALGNAQAIARRLRISRSTLQNLLGRRTYKT